MSEKEEREEATNATSGVNLDGDAEIGGNVVGRDSTTTKTTTTTVTNEGGAVARYAVLGIVSIAALAIFGVVALAIFIIYRVSPSPFIPNAQANATLPPPMATSNTTLTPPAFTPTPTLGIGSTIVSDKDSMTLVYVPAGEFLMGSTADDKDAISDEKPQHTVYLDAYWIDKTDVMNAMFAKFVAATNYKTDAEKMGSGYVFDLSSSSWHETQGADWQHPHGPSSSINSLDDYPVVQVSWNDAKAYCEWAGRQLPAEAQWEKAARGTDGSKYPWGNNPLAGNLLNFADKNLNVSWANKTIDDGYQFTSPDGHYPAGASPYGALDMAGNVWQWVADWYDENYYANLPARNPTGPDRGQHRVMRGGSWYDGARDVRATERGMGTPDYSGDTSGFRCSRSATPATTAEKTNVVPTPGLSTPTATYVPDPTNTPLPPIATAPIGIGSTQVYTDGMTGLYVPASEFLMGSTDADVAPMQQIFPGIDLTNEKPQHTVNLDAYWIDKTDVTNTMFAKFVQATHYQTDAEKAGVGHMNDFSSQKWIPITGANWQWPYGPTVPIDNQADHPVVQVSWNDAKAYCEWAGRRLPTEAEWEKAARGTDGRIYPWGNAPVAGNLLNFADRNSKTSWANATINDGYDFSSPVGHYPDGASPYGALDMAGNVWQWVADWYDANYYANSPAYNPTGPASGQSRVMRGGSWSDNVLSVRVTIRLWGAPDFQGAYEGFRCARSISP